MLYENSIDLDLRQWRQSIKLEFQPMVEVLKIELQGDCARIPVVCAIWNIQESEEVNPGRVSHGIFQMDGKTTALSDLRRYVSQIVIDVFVSESSYDRLLNILEKHHASLEYLSFEVDYELKDSDDNNSSSFLVHSFEVHEKDFAQEELGAE